MTGNVVVSEPMLVEEVFAWSGFGLNSRVTSISSQNGADYSTLLDSQFLVRTDSVSV